jgi:hypothetical protein
MISIVMTVLLFVIGHLWASRTALAKQVNDLDVRLARQEERQLATAPYFAGLQEQVINLLHHPDPGNEELDGLLDKLKNLTITAGERAHLVSLATAIAQDRSDLVRQHAATALLAVMPLVQEEAKRDPEGSARVAATPIRPTDIPLMIDPQAAAVARKQVAEAAEKLADIQTSENTQMDVLVGLLKESLHVPVRLVSTPVDEMKGTTNAPHVRTHRRVGDR